MKYTKYMKRMKYTKYMKRMKYTKYMKRMKYTKYMKRMKYTKYMKQMKYTKCMKRMKYTSIYQNIPVYTSIPVYTRIYQYTRTTFAGFHFKRIRQRQGAFKTVTQLFLGWCQSQETAFNKKVHLTGWRYSGSNYHKLVCYTRFCNLTVR